MHCRNACIRYPTDERLRQFHIGEILNMTFIFPANGKTSAVCCFAFVRGNE